MILFQKWCWTALVWVGTCAAAVAQGAWTPAGADLTYPRTLFKQSEIPALQAWLSQPEIYGLYQRLWTRAWGYVPGNFNIDGNRRAAGFAAKDAAFIYLLDRKPAAGGLDTLTDAEALILRNKAISLMELMNTAVEAYPVFESYLWRSSELTSNLTCYDLLKGAGVPDSLLGLSRQKLQEYAGNLHEEVVFNFLNLGFFSLHVDNHALRSAGALGLAAVVLNDAQSADVHERASSWINTGLYNIDNVLWRSSANAQSQAGVLAGYAEGPHYFRFGMKHVLPFFHALSNFIPDANLSCTYNGSTRTIRHPWYDPNYDLLYEWIMRIRLPDGRFPALEDSFGDVCYPDLAILEKPEYLAPMAFSRFHPGQTSNLWDQLNHSTDDMVADYIASRTSSAPMAYPEFMAMPESGNLVFRSGWDSTANYIHFTAKHGLARTSAKGHNQADVGSFILVGKGQMLALDPGYLKWDRRLEVAEARHHNMILVDGNGPAPGQTGNPGDADGFIEGTFDLGQLDYAEVRTTYQGATIVRKPMFIRRDYVLLTDACTSSQPHTFQWRLHGYGLEGGDSTHGTFDYAPVNHEGTWHKNGVSLRTHVTAKGGVDAYGKETNIHELKYDSLEEHTTFLADKQGSNVHFLSVLTPYETDTPNVQTLCGTDCGSVKVVRGGYADYATVAGFISAQSSGLPGDLSTDARLAFYSKEVQANTFAQWMMEEGTYLKIGNDSLGHASVPMDLAYAKIDPTNGEGYAGASGSFEIYRPGFVPGSVLGAQVQAWTYDAPTERLHVQVNGPGRFTVHEAVIIGIEHPSLSAELEVWPNPAQEYVHVRSPFNGGKLQLFDLQGRLLDEWEMLSSEGTVPLQQLVAKVGVLRWVSPEGQMRGKVILRH